MQALKYDGYKVVLVGDSPDFLLEPLGRSLGVSRVISNHMDMHDGNFTGLLSDEYLTGEGKATRVKAFAEEFGIDLEESIAYGGISSPATDLPLLESVGKAYAVSPADEFAAQEKGWKAGPSIRTTRFRST